MHRERNSPCRTWAMIGITETEIGHSYVRGWVTWELFTGSIWALTRNKEGCSGSVGGRYHGTTDLAIHGKNRVDLYVRDRTPHSIRDL